MFAIPLTQFVYSASVFTPRRGSACAEKVASEVQYRLQASHPDHLAAGEATVRACYPAVENPFAWPELLDEGLHPWKVGEIWLMSHPHPTHAVDVTDTFDRKIAALLEHSSQTGHRSDLEVLLRGWGGRVAAQHGLGEGRLGEMFGVVALNA